MFVKAMPQPTATPILSASDRLAAVYQLKIHLVGISPQISRRVLLRGDTTLEREDNKKFIYLPKPI